MEAMNIDPTVRAIEMLGGASAVARLRGVTPWAVSKWARAGVPAEQALWLAEQTGWRLTPHDLRPDLYPSPTDAIGDAKRAAA